MLWRQARQKHIQRDLENTQIMANSIVKANFNSTYGKNSLLIRQVAMRALKSI